MKKFKFKKFEDTQVFIENEQSSIEVKDEYLSLIKDTVMTCLKNEELKTGCELNILLADDELIKQLNKDFRNIDRPTDVLSFPIADLINGKLQPGNGDIDMDEGLLLLGDIVISLETAKMQAEQYGHTLEREFAFLTAHGVFHLLGYDHMEKEEEANMITKQEAVLEKLGLKRL